MSSFQGTNTYPQYQELSDASSKDHPVAPYYAVGHGLATRSSIRGQYPSLDGVDGYLHQGYPEGHLVQEQVYGPPGSEYRQQYQDNGPPIPADGFVIEHANLRSPTSIEISGSFNGNVGLSSTTTIPAAQYYPYELCQRMPLSTTFSASPTSNYSVASWTAAVCNRSHIRQVWLPGLNSDQGRDVFPSSGCAAFGSLNPVPSLISPFLGAVAEQPIAGFDHSVYGQHTENSSHHWTLEYAQDTLQSFPNYNSPNPLPYHGLQQSPSVGSNSRQYYGVYLPQNDSTTTSRRRKGPTRAIEYKGLRMDEEELLEGWMAPDGKITVHQCRWEQDLSPCHLWIKGDKSYINDHIQKWHGGKAGGDKLRVECRWSTCQKKMFKESIARHVVTCHLGEKWKCQGCREEIVRKDAYERHAIKEGCRDAGALIMYYADARMIDARAALTEGGGCADV
ncbi:hypothetical protein PAXRUDRAFT_832004 [Paxillus rubicundulus Ve08.2h10]|uniref:Uncharacterized protein n=1 Tax=Paxillus rubicundulus Ve08.2h10 TaxID=930991 RepID=A0A0D0DPG4_9AGAM|nr:hypothetical protein PAXRUDRAFT_832004 [Paxillus rubicundulus Ve08.2h10]